MQTEYKMQTDKTILVFVRNVVTFDFITYLLSRNYLTILISHENSNLKICGGF